MDGGIIEVGGVKYPVACNAFTPIAYSREFYVERKDGSRRPKDINEAVSMVIEVSATSNMPPIVPLLEIFYACAKTYKCHGEGQDRPWKVIRRLGLQLPAIGIRP